MNASAEYESGSLENCELTQVLSGEKIPLLTRSHTRESFLVLVLLFRCEIFVVGNFSLAYTCACISDWDIYSLRKRRDTTAKGK